MNKIKFSHEYNKMPFEDWIPNTKLEATLLEVFITEKKDLAEGFIKYDTIYWKKEGDKMVKNNYPLPNGKLLVLLLKTMNSSGSHLWTTIRRYTPEKEKYYRGLRGQEVLIEINKEVK